MIRKLSAAAVSLAVLSCAVSLRSDAAAAETTTITPVSNDKGVVTFDNGEVWYKTDELEDGKYFLVGVTLPDGTERILSTGKGDESYPVMKYITSTMVSSTSAPFSAMFLDDMCMRLNNGSADLSYSWSYNRPETWEYSDGHLIFNDNGVKNYLYYDEYTAPHFRSTNISSMASTINIYTNGETLGRCIGVQPYAESYVIAGSDYKAPVFTVEMKNENIIPDKITWYINDEEQSETGAVFTAESLRGRPVGTYNVSCLVEAHDNEEVHYREKSEDALFVVANGVIPDSVLTFSDVHQEYGLIGEAISDTMAKNNGCIPSLIVCSGDFVNGPTADHDTLMYKHLPMIRSHLGGIDSVYVSGNHESGLAAAEMTISCGLGADESFLDSCGQIFSGSTSAPDIAVYGINYSAVESETEDGKVYSYDHVIEDLDSFLSERAKNYHGELIIISAHAGLHTVGVQPQSVNPLGIEVTKWAGTYTYNISGSYELTQLINKYADEYDMDIMYLFGHNHSRGEAEFLLPPGSELFSTVDSYEKTFDSQNISFTYAHSGYLSNNIGSADGHYSLIRRDKDSIIYEMSGLNDGQVRKDVIPLRYKPVATTASTTAATTVSTVTTAVSTSTVSATASSSSTAAKTTSAKKHSPLTSDDFTVLPVLIPAGVLLMISRKKRSQ